MLRFREYKSGRPSGLSSTMYRDERTPTLHPFSRTTPDNMLPCVVVIHLHDSPMNAASPMRQVAFFEFSSSALDL